MTIELETSKSNDNKINGSPLKNHDISGAIFTLSLRSQWVEGARDVIVLELTSITLLSGKRLIKISVQQNGSKDAQMNILDGNNNAAI